MIQGQPQGQRNSRPKSYSHSGTQPLSTQVDLVVINLHHPYANCRESLGKHGVSNSIGTPVRDVIANSQHEHRRHPARERLQRGEPGRVVSYHQRMQLGLLPRQCRKRNTSASSSNHCRTDYAEHGTRQSGPYSSTTRLNQRQRRCTLCHELVHARHHDPGCGTRYGIKCERRWRRETALALISPVDYGMAETVYEGNTWMMAVESGVIIQVLNDYRQLLYDSGVCVQ